MSCRKKWLVFICVFVAFWILPLFAEGPYLVKLRRDNGKVDVVYTWVNGADSEWLQKYNRVNETYTLPRTVEANFRCRFRNRDELKYSMRSVYMFAHFVNHIYIVTDGQRPEWLKDHPKVSLVCHADIFRDHGNLPTFNSMAIEANLHHIQGLQERFIYFNDDVFIGRPLNKRAFYSIHGKVKMFTTKRRAPSGWVRAMDNGFAAGWKNTNAFLSNLGVKKKRYILEHAPFPLRKSHLEQFERLFPSIINSNSLHKFRSPGDYGILNGLIQNFSLYHKQARKGTLRGLMVPINADFIANYRNLERLLRKRPHLFCLEDVGNLDNSEVDEQMRDFLEMLFYEKAPWEK